MNLRIAFAIAVSFNMSPSLTLSRTSPVKSDGTFAYLQQVLESEYQRGLVDGAKQTPNGKALAECEERLNRADEVIDLDELGSQRARRDAACLVQIRAAAVIGMYAVNSALSQC